MTKEEIKALIAAKIAGQGDQIDIAGALASILLELSRHSIALEVSDITKLTNEELDSLEVGDKVAKITENQKHLYIVSYKGDGEGEGLCLSYNAAGYGETVSYDRSGSGWAFNSVDVKTYGE